MARTRIPLSAAEEDARDLREKLELSTAEIGLTVRTTNCLEEKGIFTVKDLLNTTRAELLSISNFGEKTCLLYTSPSPRDQRGSRMPSSA